MFHSLCAAETFAMKCWTSGIRPEEALQYPPDAAWLVAVLAIIGEMSANQGAG